jgi:hypothetical protein
VEETRSAPSDVSPDAVRCSDAERERTGAKLHAAVGEGRLTMAEVEERLAKTYAARYRHELDGLTADLPEPAPAGWRPILTMATRQLASEMSVLLGRGGAVSTRRRLLLALATLLFVAMAVTLAVHGILDQGPEHHGFSHE